LRGSHDATNTLCIRGFDPLQGAVNDDAERF